MLIRGRSALVTGASGGIGSAVAGALAEAGASRLVLSGRDPAALDAVVRRTGGRPVLGDLTSPSGLRAVADAAAGTDVLVLAAGVGWAGEFVDMPEEALRDLLAADVAATMELARRLVPGAVARRAGHVVLVGSIAGVVGVAGETAYSAAKAAIATFADVLRREVEPRGVRVTHVVPGVVDTAFFARRGRPYDRARPRPVPAARVARALVRGVESDRAEVFVPGWLRGPARLHGAAPGLYRALERRLG